MQQVKAKGSSSNVNITGFDLDQAGLGKYMRQAKGGGSRGGQEGVVVSHAGMFHSRSFLSFVCSSLVLAVSFAVGI